LQYDARARSLDETFMSDSIGKFLLRVTLGVVILLHGIAKLRYGIGGVERMVVGHGLPDYVAYGVYVGEVIAPLLVIAGWYARVGAALVAVNMLFAIGLAHRGDLLSLGPQSGWAVETQALMLAAALAVALCGAGRFALNQR
jgi:putative oxidoreductase